jgi:hypothetical protein
MLFLMDKIGGFLLAGLLGSKAPPGAPRLIPKLVSPEPVKVGFLLFISVLPWANVCKVNDAWLRCNRTIIDRRGCGL